MAVVVRKNEGGRLERGVPRRVGMPHPTVAIGRSCLHSVDATDNLLLERNEPRAEFHRIRRRILYGFGGLGQKPELSLKG